MGEWVEWVKSVRSVIWVAWSAGEELVPFPASDFGLRTSDLAIALIVLISTYIHCPWSWQRFRAAKGPVVYLSYGLRCSSVVLWSCSPWSCGPVIPFEPANLSSVDQFQFATEVMKGAEVAPNEEQHHGDQGENDDQSRAGLAAGGRGAWRVRSLHLFEFVV